MRIFNRDVVLLVDLSMKKALSSRKIENTAFVEIDREALDDAEDIKPELWW